MNNGKCVLIGGGSGMIGKRLTELLLQNGYQVRHLGRKAGKELVDTYAWDLANKTVDPRAFGGVQVIVNLAGANISGHRWTDSYKKELLDSRIVSTRLIVEYLNNHQHSVSHFVSGSAIGYYGFGDHTQWFRETDAPSTDFLAGLVRAWETEAARLNSKSVKLSFLRTGIVFGREGGALEAMRKPIELYAGAPLGDGRQYISWIHIDDICRLIIHIIEKDIEGAMNGVAPAPSTNEEVTKGIAKRLGRPLILPHIPAFMLKLILGEMSDAVVKGARVSSEKAQASGFTFQFPTLDRALDDLVRRG